MAFVASGRVSAESFQTHEEGHSAALNAALDDLARQVNTPETFDNCEIAYFAKVSVTNPAVVDEYIAIVTTP